MNVAQHTMPSLLLVDDKKELLDQLRAGLEKIFTAEEAVIHTWVPSKDDLNPLEVFNGKVGAETILVVTDYDLTGQGNTGLFGPSIVGWCQRRAIPVGDFSRGHRDELPKEPNLFELRVPTDHDEAARYVASVYRGFKWIREKAYEKQDILLTRSSPSAALAELLEEADAESQFALYTAPLSSSNSGLIEHFTRTAPSGLMPDGHWKASLLSYIVGHLLLNAVLKYPGPILSEHALAAYLAIDKSELDAVIPLFNDAVYSGPFSDINGGCFFWKSKLDRIFDQLVENIPDDILTETEGELNRIAVEVKIGRNLRRHTCNRCGGRNGGFLCPFTGRSVCHLSNCSVTASSWIPQGAQLCRVEKIFYDEWAPLLGL